MRVAGDGIDNDGNGWVDDVNGLNLADGNANTNNPNPSGPNDRHGTAVAGVAAARGDNSIGVAGGSFGSEIMAIKPYNENADGSFSVSFSNIASAIYYASGRTADGLSTWRGADVTNHSYSLGGTSTAINQAFDWGNTNGRNGHGVAHFASSGNGASGYDRFSTNISIPFNLFDEGAQVQIRYAKDVSLDDGEDALWVANVHQPGGIVNRFDTFGNFEGWTGGGDVIGFMTGDLTHQYGTGRNTLQSGNITHNQTSSFFSPEIESSGNFRFDYWVSSESGFDGMEVLVRYRTGLFGEWGSWSQVGGLISGVPDVDSGVGYPSSHGSVISVGASTDFDYRSDYSQYSSALDFVAPSGGGNSGVFTTDRTGSAGYDGSDYVSVSGTSFSSPLAAGAAGLLIAKNPEITAAEIRTALQNSAVQIGGVTYSGGVNSHYGHGRLHARNALGQIPFDDNDTISEATFIEYDSTTTGRLGTSDDVDMYAITVNAGDVLGFDLDNEAGDTNYLDTFLRLFDSSGNLVTASDDAAGPLPEVRPIRESFIPYTFNTGGTYYLGVSAFGNSNYDPTDGNTDSDAGSAGNYNLIVHDLNDEISEATSINVGSSGSGHISYDSDVSLFSFTASAGQTLGFDIDNDSGSTLDSRIRVFDSSGVELTENDDRIGPAPEEYFREGYTEFSFTTGGTYYAGVSYYQNDSYNITDGTGDYTGFSNTGGFSLNINDLTPTGPIVVTSASDSDDGIIFDDITLREAIKLANVTPGLNEIEFDTGGTFSTPQTINLTGQLPTISGDLNINGPGSDYLEINGQDSHLITYISDTTGLRDVSINNLTMSNGRGFYGGAINNNENLTLSGVVLQDNLATANGGAISGGGTIRIEDSLLTGNSANNGGAVSAGALLVYGSTFDDNHATSGNGGAIRTGGSGNVIDGSTFTNNTASSLGGAIATTAGSTDVRMSIISGNDAALDGGGIYNGPSATLDVFDSTFYDNDSVDDGGGLANEGMATITSSTFHNNNATDTGGGGGGVINGFGATITVDNSTFSNNFAEAVGGGFANFGTATINSSTFSGNTSNDTGGVYNGSGDSLTMNNTIVANSTAGDLTNNGGTLAGSFNLVEDGLGTAGLTDTLSGDPMLDGLGGNGGPTLTHALLEASPAINAGNTAIVGGTDQRGEARVVGGVVDIGAYETDPAVVRTLGFIPAGMTTQPTYDLREQEVAFYRFELDADVLAANGDGLAIDTNGSVLGDGSFNQNDTEIGLYDAAGNRIANDDDGGIDRLSRIGLVSLAPMVIWPQEPIT